MVRFAHTAVAPGAAMAQGLVEEAGQDLAQAFLIEIGGGLRCGREPRPACAFHPNEPQRGEQDLDDLPACRAFRWCSKGWLVFTGGAYRVTQRGRSRRVVPVDRVAGPHGRLLELASR